MLKYQIPNQLTGITEEVDTWEEAIALKTKIVGDYLTYLGELHSISVLIQNEDGSWTQTLADDNGYPTPPWIPE